MLDLILSFISIIFLFSPPVIPEPVSAKLVMDKEIVAAGNSFRIGVHYTIAPGWHIYWKDSGDSGLPTKINFELPAGYEISELRWPAHEIFTMPGDIKGNGYSGEVLLWAEVHVPKDAAGNIPLKVKTTWLNCSKDLCIPAKQRFESILTLGTEKLSEQFSFFNLWQSRLPTL